MAEVVLKFADDEQYKKFLNDIKQEVLNEINGRIPKSHGWTKVRLQIEEKLRSDYNNGCGWWHTNLSGLYAAFRLAFQVKSIRDLDAKNDEDVQNFCNELFALIDKYREKNKSAFEQKEVS